MLLSEIFNTVNEAYTVAPLLVDNLYKAIVEWVEMLRQKYPIIHHLRVRFHLSIVVNTKTTKVPKNN